MADDMITSPLVPPATADRVNGVGQRHTSMNQHAFSRRLPRKEDGQPREDGEHLPQRPAGEEMQREEERNANRAAADREPAEDDIEAPGRLVNVVA